MCIQKSWLFFFSLLLGFHGFGQKINEPKLVVIDAGHGGKDHGTHGKSCIEKDITLKFSKLIRDKIFETAPNISVILTRENDIFLPLRERTGIANASQADLFISIHCNHLDITSVNGTEIYIMGLAKADDQLEVTKRENIIFEEDMHDVDSDENHIFSSLYQNIILENSMFFGQQLMSLLNQNTPLKQRGVKQAGFIVLHSATMPAVLLETAYLSNQNDEQYLLSKEGETAIVNSTADAIIKFLNENIEIDANHTSKNNESYAIMLLESISPKAFENDEKWSYIKDFQILDNSGNFQYLTGNYNQFDEAQSQLSFFKNIGFSNAQIILQISN